VKEFFDGAGYGFTHIISLIVTANCFGKAIEHVGLAKALGELITQQDWLLVPLAGAVPWAFAAVSGSGMASTQSLYGFFHGPAVNAGHDPAAVGAVVSLASAAGRTMSPVAAVTLMCCTLTGAKPFELVRRAAPPLMIGLVVVVGLRALKVI
jgi:DcuC family C4-dicarboxylate transporter